MGKRHQAEMKAFKLAEKKRLDLIEDLKKCNSSHKLDEALKGYEKKKKKHYYALPGSLTDHHCQIIVGLNDQINRLIEEKGKLFSPPPSVQTKSSEVSHGIVVQEISTPSTDKLPLATLISNVESGSNEFSIGEKMDSSCQETVLVTKSKDIPQVTDISSKNKKSNTSAEAPKTEPKYPLEAETSQIKKDRIKQELISKYGSLLQQQRATDRVPTEAVKTKENAVDERIRRHRSSHLIQVRSQLRVIRTKQKEFEATYKEHLKNGKQKEAEKYQKASDAANNIHSEITCLSNKYILDGDLESFKKESQAVLHEDQDNVKTLQEHRGWKSILANLAVFVFTAGLAHAGYSLYKRDFSLFNPATDASKKVADLHESINTIAVSA